jgi:DNA-binding transcriptional ArsR family regulator
VENHVFAASRPAFSRLLPARKNKFSLIDLCAKRNAPNLGILSPSGLALMKDRQEFERCADRLKALTDPSRLRMIDALFQGEATVSSLAEVVGQQITMASHHLSVLLKAGVVTSRRDGRFVYYSLHPDVVRRKDDKLLRQINLVDCTVDFEMAEPVPSFSGSAEPRAD